MRTVAIVNQKGGSGKTTTAINLASILARRGQRTLLVDIDPQSHCALGLAVPDATIECGIADALSRPEGKRVDPSRLFWRINKHLDLIPSTTKLAGLEAARGALAGASDREERLLRVLRPYVDKYDWCLIDCSPSIGLLTFNALRAATFVLIPVETGYFALRGAERQAKALEALIRRCGHGAAYRVFATMHREESRVGKDVLAQLRARFEKSLIPVVVRFDEALRESASLGTSILDHAPDSDGARDYTALAAWMLEHVPDASPREPPPPDVEVGPWDNASERAPDDAEEDVPTLEPVTARIEVAGSTISRAAELAARARQISHRNAELQQRIESDDRAVRIMQEVASIGGAKLEPKPAFDDSSDREVSPDLLTSLYGARVTSRGVLFVYPAGPDVEVCVAADVNGWSPTAHRLTYNRGLAAHEICIPFPKGAHRYRYVVDGQWIADPHNRNTAPNPYGQFDSVVDVGSSES